MFIKFDLIHDPTFIQGRKTLPVIVLASKTKRNLPQANHPY